MECMGGYVVVALLPCQRKALGDRGTPARHIYRSEIQIADDEPCHTWIPFSDLRCVTVSFDTDRRERYRWAVEDALEQGVSIILWR